MAPQRLEKIESAPGNGMASEALKLQDLVHGRAAERALRLEHGLKSGIGAAAREELPGERMGRGSPERIGDSFWIESNFCRFFLSDKAKS